MAYVRPDWLDLRPSHSSPLLLTVHCSIFIIPLPAIYPIPFRLVHWAVVHVVIVLLFVRVVYRP